MRQKGISLGTLHITGCLILFLNSLLFMLPGVTYAGPSGVMMTFTLSNMLWIFAFPIFAFLMVEEYHHTDSFPKLAASILVLAILFEVPFDLVQSRRPFALYLNNQFFTLFFGALSLRILTGRWNPALKFVGVAVLCVLSSAANFEYGMCGVLLVVLFQLTRSLPLKRWVQLGCMLILAWLCLRLSLRGWMSMIDPGYIPFFNGLRVRAQYLYVLSLIPVSLWNSTNEIRHRLIVLAAYGLLPVTYLIVYFICFSVAGA